MSTQTNARCANARQRQGASEVALPAVLLQGRLTVLARQGDGLLVVAARGRTVTEVPGQDRNGHVANVRCDRDGNLDRHLVAAQYVDDGDVDQAPGDDRRGGRRMGRDGQCSGEGRRHDCALTEILH